MLKQAVILAGGKGTRLKRLTTNIPKPMLEIDGHPFITYLIHNLQQHGIKKILISTGYKSDCIESFFSNQMLEGMEINCLAETKPLGTGGALKFVSPYLDSEFLVLNGDTLFDINFIKLHDLLSESSDGIVSIALRHTYDESRYGQVVRDREYIVSFSEKESKKLSTSAIINGGIYFMSSKVLNYIPEGYSSLENDIFPVLASKRILLGKIFSGYFIDIGVPNEFKRVQVELPIWMEKKYGNDLAF